MERAERWSQLIPSTCFETKAHALDPRVGQGKRGMAVGISRRGGGGCDGEMSGSSGCSRRVGEGEKGQNQRMGRGG